MGRDGRKFGAMAHNSRQSRTLVSVWLVDFSCDEFVISVICTLIYLRVRGMLCLGEISDEEFGDSDNGG